MSLPSKITAVVKRLKKGGAKAALADSTDVTSAGEPGVTATDLLAKRPPISVALAAKDGARFLVEQVVSILPQLTASDELIISVDPSEDDTLELARALAETTSGAAAPRFTVLEGPGRTIAANFEQALRACTNEIIFLADQDDIWLEDKVSTILKAFARSDALLICHDAAIVDEHLNLLELSYFSWHKSHGGLVRSVLRNSYVGCCLALRRELLNAALPFPPNIPMHDQWLGCLAERFRRTLFLESPLILYRRHSANSTSDRHAGLKQMLGWRAALLKALIKRKSPQRPRGPRKGIE
ncbi:MAG: glycosyltransferase [Coriobacteriales bacterium]|jgi:glycosyltransferase involved in cell wall biosynthesis|nr:glycosyltransferase [Coriobacteriales bacterium]